MVNLANGTERNHQPDEAVTLDALATMADVTYSLIAQATLMAAQTKLVED